MSKVYFQDRGGVAWVAGFERPNFANLIHSIFWGLIESLASEEKGRESPIRKILSNHSLARMDVGPAFTECLHLQMQTTAVNFSIDGTDVSAYSVAANTSLVVGNDAWRFIVRLDGQVELQPFVEGKNRVWMAEIIQQGRREGILREGAGWEDVVSLLLRSRRSPVTLGYDVCQSPAQSESTFRRRVAGLRERARTAALEWRPETWGTFRYRGCLTAFDLLKLR